ncbi:splicing factor 3b subunit 6 [Anaeramoeba flamelloides]|uniref:Splicing factor 3b subunit n=1 Tax=Anaeramoeba flamelloides TaxID=1746091 RepID=A0AAV7Z9L6_9EUKA|nr:splicing factor 3b subunit [Anaeramoeba flamelloides]KAJ6244962.1 splicing factor 3b subunit 6 [Anaeramoeba flamelloides]
MNKNQPKVIPPDVNRILYVRNLPYKITSEEMYDIFGRYGGIRQIRLGDKNKTRGTAYVVYEDIIDAKNACEHLSGFHVRGRYLIVLYHKEKKKERKPIDVKRQKEINALRQKYGLNKK